ncbi:MAG: YdeI/OmpD-associated family protein [Anaerolineaceae bacterium]|nr:YdeI/OmpD-associated family protein [Anaerolineaceae bacterium]
MNPDIDLYIANGCGRCPLGGTPNCKTLTWPEELKKLRSILLDSELTEELKWSVPCYTYDNKNILIMAAFKEYCAISFFKGVLLKDPNGILETPGKNTQAGRLLKFTNVNEIIEMESIIKAYIQEAIHIEMTGLKVEYKKTIEYDMPEELLNKLDEDPAFNAAFESLTPGRQRGYLLHFSAPKQSQTRVSRIEKCTEKIFEGKGLNER